MKWICRICSKTFNEEDIPTDATKLIGTRSTSILYRFPDGEIHDLRRDRTEKQKYTVHKRFHVATNVSVSGCQFCDEKPVEPDPVEVFLDEEPIGVPIPVNKAPAATPAEPETAMSLAFRRIKETNTNG